MSRTAALELLSGVRCQSIHQQTDGAACVNCQSWARTIGAPFWAPLLAEIVTSARPMPTSPCEHPDCTRPGMHMLGLAHFCEAHGR